jgi:hypothetical protein
MLRDKGSEERSARRVWRLSCTSQSICQNRDFKLRVIPEGFIERCDQLMLSFANVESGQVYSSSGASNLGLDVVSAGWSQLIIRLNNLQCFIESGGRVENLKLGGLDLEPWSHMVKLGRDADQRVSGGC